MLIFGWYAHVHKLSVSERRQFRVVAKNMKLNAKKQGKQCAHDTQALLEAVRLEQGTDMCRVKLCGRSKMNVLCLRRRGCCASGRKDQNAWLALTRSITWEHTRGMIWHLGTC